jgi:hypothetical protein
MTVNVASGIQYGSGARYGVAFAIDQTTGRIKGNSASTPYEGIPFVGAKTWNLTIPKLRRINHINADRIGAADFLPPTEAASATIMVSADNMQMDEILTGNKQVTIAKANSIGDLTSNQGFEPLVALHLYQQSLDFQLGLRRWRSFLVPRAKAIPLPGGFADREVDGTYDVLMTPSHYTIFGTLLDQTIDGFTDAQLFRLMSTGRPAIAAWIGNGYTVLFSFPADKSPTIDITTVAVYKNGTKLTSGYTASTTGVTFVSAPLSTDDITIYWEH